MTYQYLAYTQNVHQNSQATYSFSVAIQSFPAELDKTSVIQSTAPGNWFCTQPDLYKQNIISITL